MRNECICCCRRSGTILLSNSNIYAGPASSREKERGRGADTPLVVAWPFGISVQLKQRSRDREELLGTVFDVGVPNEVKEGAFATLGHADLRAAGPNQATWSHEALQRRGGRVHAVVTVVRLGLMGGAGRKLA